MNFFYITNIFELTTIAVFYLYDVIVIPKQNKDSIINDNKPSIS